MPFSKIFHHNIKSATLGLLLFCVSIALSACAAGGNAAGQSPESLEVFPAEPQTEQASEPEATPASESAAKPQPESTEESESTAEPKLTDEPEASIESAPSEEPKPTNEPEPILTADYELIHKGINLFDIAAGSAFQYMNSHADLYRRRLQDDTGEYIELSLWSGQREVWYTAGSDDTEEYNLLYRKHSECLALDQRLCYYVLELNGTVYLMRYCVETASNAVTMSYKVFGINPLPNYSFRGEEEPFDVGSITVYLTSNDAVDPAVSFPVAAMTAFADTVRGYMKNGYLAASTLQGVFEFESSSDQDNPVSPYLYDIFPWIPELAEKCGVTTNSIHSAEKLLKKLQKSLPAEPTAVMPDIAADGSYFITGDYYSANDDSFLTIRMEKGGAYGGHLLIDNALNADFIGYYDNGILYAVQTDNYPECTPYEMEMSFQKGRATITITVRGEESFVEAGETLTVDRNEKPECLEIMRHAEPHRVE